MTKGPLFLTDITLAAAPAAAERLSGRTPRYRTAPYVYRVWDDDVLIYIGSTCRLWRRLDEHRRDSWWAETATRAQAKVFPAIEDARRVEKQAILDEVPRWNLHDLRPQLRFMNEEQWDDYLVRVATARRNEIEWRHRKGLPLPTTLTHPGEGLGLEWLVRRYRFHFGHDYDRSRLDAA